MDPASTRSYFDAAPTTDVCIVGAGAAGLTLAAELANSGLSVVILEAGGSGKDAAIIDDYRGEAAAPHAKPEEFRRFGLGGSTALWGGRCVPLDPIDFEHRTWIPGSGWPIAYSEIERHYAKAMEHCDAGDFDFSATGSLPGHPPTIGGWGGDREVLADRIERYSLPTDFGRKYRDLLSRAPNVVVLTGARCVGVRYAASEERIDGLDVVLPNGTRHVARATHYVLATGGIEVPRLLLAAGAASDSTAPGNATGHVGRHYMCHFENLCARVIANGAPIVFDFERTKSGIYCRRKFQLSDGVQREQRLPNSAFRLHFPNYSDARHGSSVMSAIYLAKSVLVSEYQELLGKYAEADEDKALASHLRNVVTGMPELARFARRWLFDRQLAQRKLPYTLVPNADGSYPIEFNSEQTPLADSKISLSAAKDRHGLPRVRIDWRLCDEDVEGMVRALALFRNGVERGSRCKVVFDEESIRARLYRSHPVGGHHIGTARMATSPATGVVDTNCAVFGAPNLFVASSAVFPTSGHANPTLTIVALAVRLANHLRSISGR